MICNAEIVPTYSEDLCGGEKKDARCVIDNSVYIDLGIEINSNQQDINQAVYNALQASKTTTDELQLQIDDLIPATYLVANLPTGTLGSQAIVTDATAPTYLGVLVGGGTVKCPVWHNGTIWVSR
jgi:hypothetical protein